MGGKAYSQKHSLKLFMRHSQAPAIDLHGRTEDEIFDLLDQFIRKHQNQEQVIVIVGKGRGIVRKKVLEYLEMAHYSWSYETVRGIFNEGALIVNLLY